MHCGDRALPLPLLEGDGWTHESGMTADTSSLRAASPSIVTAASSIMQAAHSEDSWAILCPSKATRTSPEANRSSFCKRLKASSHPLSYCITSFESSFLSVVIFPILWKTVSLAFFSDVFPACLSLQEVTCKLMKTEACATYCPRRNYY